MMAINQQSQLPLGLGNLKKLPVYTVPLMISSRILQRRGTLLKMLFVVSSFKRFEKGGVGCLLKGFDKT